jgi:putative phosphoribosyl transferase
MRAAVGDDMTAKPETVGRVRWPAASARTVGDNAVDPLSRSSGEVEVVGEGLPQLAGYLVAPSGAAGIVLFAHGSGSSRHSPRNRYVASVLAGAGLGVLLFDLLTSEEESDRAKVFAIPLLAGRLLAATAWLRRRPEARTARLGYFGASTGAAAALWAAAEDDGIGAVVSRGGRPDLAGPRLPAVRAATLLIVGGADELVLDLNRQARAQLRCENALEVVPGAGHLFEEPGTLQQAAELARGWFLDNLRVTGPPTVR